MTRTPVFRLTAIAATLMATSMLIALPQAASAQDAVPQNDLLNATLWMPKSVEYKANTLAIYALARMQLDAALADKNWTAIPDEQGEAYADKPAAIILDADETVLDNSVYEASLIQRGTGFSGKEWTAYVKDEVTKAIPGAVEFTQYAASRGVKVFYVTNRTKEEEPATVENMTKLGFAMGGNVDTVLTKGEQEDWKSAKGTRRSFVAKDYRVLLLLGDNLGDFVDDYNGDAAARMAVYEKNMSHWTKDWLMLPNPSYGSWESTMFGNNYKLPADEQRKMKIDQLEGWKPAQ